jgi:hypothetical protein
MSTNVWNAVGARASLKNTVPKKITNATDLEKYFTITNSSTPLTQTWDNETLKLSSPAHTS